MQSKSMAQIQNELEQLEECKSQAEDSMMSSEVSQFQEEMNEEQPPRIRYNQKCDKHNLIIHSYVKTSKELLCTKCIYDKNLTNS